MVLTEQQHKQIEQLFTLYLRFVSNELVLSSFEVLLQTEYNDQK